MQTTKLREMAKTMNKHDMVYLMLEWAKANPLPMPWDDEEGADSEKALVIICQDALYASGRDDWGGCVLCRS